MLMTDLMTKEQWADFERKLHEERQLNACAYNAEGFTFTGFKNFINPLCAEIKSYPAGIQQICSVAHQHMAKQAQATGRTVVEQCDAGLLKITTPVFVDGEFVGIVGGCGRLAAGEKVETFAVHKATGSALDKVEDLAGKAPSITMSQADDIVEYLEEFVAKLVACSAEA